MWNYYSYLLKRPVGRPPKEFRRYYPNFTYQVHLPGRKLKQVAPDDCQE
jgi:hypothetical protein